MARFTPATGYTGTAAFAYTATQSGGETAGSNVTVRVLASDAAPVVSAPGFMGGAWNMTVSGPPGFDYTIQASTNLADWTPLDTRVSPALPISWSDPASADFPRRFYRVLLEP